MSVLFEEVNVEPFDASVAGVDVWGFIAKGGGSNGSDATAVGFSGECPAPTDRCGDAEDEGKFASEADIKHTVETAATVDANGLFFSVNEEGYVTEL